MKKDSATNQFVKNYFWNFLMVFVSRLGGLIFVAIIARLLLPEGYGIYALATSMALFVMSFTQVGMCCTVSRYVSDALGKNDKKLAASYCKFLSKIKFLFALSSAVLLLFLAYPLSFYVFNKPDLFFPLLISAIFIFVMYSQVFYESLFYAIKKIRYLTFKETILQASRIIFILILVLAAVKSYYVSGAVFSLIFSSLFALVFLWIYVKKETPFLFIKSYKKIDKKRVLNFLTHTISSGISEVIFGDSSIILIGIFFASSYVGYYSAALVIATGLCAFISISNLSLPIFTQICKKDLSDAFNNFFKYTSIISIPLIFGVLCLGNHLLRLIYGYEYLPAAIPLSIFALLIFEMPISANLKALFYARENPKQVVKTIFFAVILNVVLDIIFIVFLLRVSAIWAITGVAAATVISRMFILISLSVAARKKLSIHYNLKSIIRPVIASFIMMLVILLINSQIKDVTLLIGILEVILGAVVYFVLLVLLKGLKREDYHLIRLLRPHNLLNKSDAEV